MENIGHLHDVIDEINNTQWSKSALSLRRNPTNIDGSSCVMSTRHVLFSWTLPIVAPDVYAGCTVCGSRYRSRVCCRPTKYSDTFGFPPTMPMECLISRHCRTELWYVSDISPMPSIKGIRTTAWARAARVASMSLRMIDESCTTWTATLERYTSSTRSWYT